MNIRNTRNYIYLAFFFALVLLVTIGVLSYRATKENEENIAWLVHTHQVLAESERLFSEVKDAQRAQRGFLLTKDSFYITGYQDSKASIFKIFDQLKVLTSDQSIQQERLKMLYSLINEAFSYWDNTIALSRKGQHEEALRLVKAGVGREIAGRIGVVINEFKVFEQLLLAERQESYANSRRYSNYIEIIGGSVALLILILAFYTLRNLLNREKDLTNTLEEKVEERTKDLKNSIDALRKTNEELDNFVYTASHDLRTPVLNLHGLQQVLRTSFNGGATPKQEKYLSLMDTSIFRLNKTVVELANLAKVSRENLPSETLSFPVILKEVLEDIHPLVEQTHAEITTEFQVEEILYPAAHLRSVLYNLISNAIKYHAPERKPTVQIKTFLNNQGIICLSVEDNGLGLEPHQVEKLFTMYKRYHTHVEGSGVGLAMIKRIVENQGGAILVDSTKGIGSTFKVFFK